MVKDTIFTNLISVNIRWLQYGWSKVLRIFKLLTSCGDYFHNKVRGPFTNELFTNGLVELFLFQFSDCVNSVFILEITDMHLIGIK